MRTSIYLLDGLRHRYSVIASTSILTLRNLLNLATETGCHVVAADATAASSQRTQYQQALGEFIRCVRKPDFDPHKPLRLIQRIAKFRVIDRARRKKASRIRKLSHPLVL